MHHCRPTRRAGAHGIRPLELEPDLIQNPVERVNYEINRRIVVVGLTFKLAACNNPSRRRGIASEIGEA